jgi:hypothetical protein
LLNTILQLRFDARSEVHRENVSQRLQALETRFKSISASPDASKLKRSSICENSKEKPKDENDDGA